MKISLFFYTYSIMRILANTSYFPVQIITNSQMNLLVPPISGIRLLLGTGIVEPLDIVAILNVNALN